MQFHFPYDRLATLESGASRRPSGWIAAIFGAGLLLACPAAIAQDGATQSRPDPVTVRRGAQLAGTFTPQEFRGNLRDLPKVKQWQPGDAIRTIPRRPTHREKYQPPGAPANPVLLKQDPLLDLQESGLRSPSLRVLQADNLNFAGQGFNGVYPPDTVGEVGVDHYIQMTNSNDGSSVTIFNKADGSIAAGPFALTSLWTNGGNCASGLGDPVVLYDTLADRWLLTEFSSSGNRLCIYVAKTSDPIAGGWYLYDITSRLSFPDYPKYAIWPDAYYLTTNETSPGAYALNRVAMLSGGAAAMQFFSAPSLDGFQFQTLTPADLDGTTAPATGAPGLMIRHRDDEVHNASSNNSNADYLDLFEFHVDWTTPANSSLTGPVSIAVSEFDSDLCGLISYQCFPQPGTTKILDPLREVVMWRFAYRNFDSYESLVGNFVTDVDNTDHGGIRWFELRKAGTDPWALRQEGTYAPDSLNRWMGSIAQDRQGNIALGYSAGNSATAPGIRYTGRRASDTLGVMTQGEFTLQNAAGSQTGSNRWGDYSAMSIDPVDGCTFWYTNEYGSGSGTWSTRIGTLSFQECTDPGFFLTSSSNLSQSVCAGSNLSAIDVQVESAGGYTNPVTLSLASPPSGISGTFTTNPVTPGNASTLTVAVGSGVSAGTYALSVAGTGSGATDQTLALSAQVYKGIPGTTTLLTPANGAADQLLMPSFTWSAVSGAQKYRIDIAEDSSFTQVVDTAEVAANSYTPTGSLPPATTLFWRVTAISPCGNASASATFSFSTLAEYCRSPALAIADNDPVGVTDSYSITSTRLIEDLSLQIEATHSYPGDLIVTLTHVESGTSVVLMDRPGVPASANGCRWDDVDATLDDEGTAAVEDTCTGTIPGITGTLTPNNPLTAFDGQTIGGTWTLTVSDNALDDTGQLARWCLIPTLSAASACDGTSVIYEGVTIPAGTTVNCNAVDITVQNVTVEGTLNITRTGKANIKPTVRTVPPGTMSVR